MYLSMYVHSHLDFVFIKHLHYVIIAAHFTTYLMVYYYDRSYVPSRVHNIL